MVVQIPMEKSAGKSKDFGSANVLIEYGKKNP
jgi:hypothetical protein